MKILFFFLSPFFFLLVVDKLTAALCHLLLPSSREDKNPEEAFASCPPPHSPRSPLLLFLSRNRAQSLTLAFTAAVVHLTSPANQTSSRPETLSNRLASSSSTRRCHAFVLGVIVAVERRRRPEQPPWLSTKNPTPSSLLRSPNLVLYVAGELCYLSVLFDSSIASSIRGSVIGRRFAAAVRLVRRCSGDHYQAALPPVDPPR